MDQTKVEQARLILQQRYPKASLMLLAGSLVRGEGTPYSDLDLVIIFPELAHAYRESFIFDGTLVETFVHDATTLEYFFAEFDRPSGKPALMQMVIEGIPLPEPGSESDRLKAMAQRYLDEGPPALTAEQIDRQRYFINDMLDDIRAPRSYAELVATGANLYQALAEFYCRAQQRWTGAGKSIPRVLAKYDPDYERRFSSSFEQLFRDGNPSAVIELAEQTVAPYGGLLFDGFRLDAPKDWRKKG